jgi:hypothetical protein
MISSPSIERIKKIPKKANKLLMEYFYILKLNTNTFPSDLYKNMECIIPQEKP